MRALMASAGEVRKAARCASMGQHADFDKVTVADSAGAGCDGRDERAD
jgi:hypothetical protein